MSLSMTWCPKGLAAPVPASPVIHPSTGARSQLASFRLQPGFKIELVAAEPMVVAPVALAFDENCRLFVAENPDLRSGGGGQARGRVRVLDGMDDDGFPQNSTIYAEGVRWPSALACYANGVFVASTPDVIYFKATQAGGGADTQQTVVTGFGASNNVSSSTLMNNFIWGLNDRFYGVGVPTEGTVTVANGASRPTALGDHNFSFDPQTLAVQPEAGPAQSGLSFDNNARMYLSDRARPLRLAMYEPRYLARNPFFCPAPELVNVISPATSVYTPRPGAPASRTNTIAVWMTNAQGVVIYRGSAFPTNYLGNAFIADPDARVIHRVVLRENGLGVAAETSLPDSKGEFLTSEDPAFRPVQVVNGPDGALYIADLRDGREQGRIYRVVPASFKPPKPVQLGKATAYELVSTLASTDGWHRDTAARLLFERQDATAIPLLSNMLFRSRLPLARVHALHALAGAGALGEAHVLQALRDPDAVVRERGVLLSERLVTNGIISDALWGPLSGMSADPSIRVRYQLAFTLGEIRRPDKVQVLSQILNQNLDHPWVQTAVMSSLGQGAGNLLIMLTGNSGFRNSAVGLDYLRRLAMMIGVQGRLDDVAQVMNYLAGASVEPLTAYSLLDALGEGLYRTRSSLTMVDRQGALQAFYSQAVVIAIDPGYLEPLRVEAIRLVGFIPYTFADVGDWLLLLCNPPPMPAVQSAAVETLGRLVDSGVSLGLVNGWGALNPSLRNQAISALLSRKASVGLVLNALENGKILASDFSATQINFLRTYRIQGISDRAVKLFGPVPINRPEAIEQYKPSLRLTGIADRGRDLFSARCVACHQFGGTGQFLGPDLTGAKTRGREYLLSAILEPNARLRPDYLTCVVESKDGESLIGVVTGRNPSTLTLRQPGAAPQVWPLLNVESVQTQPWSIMPTGLEQGLSPQDMADLLAFLMSAP